MFNIPHSTEYFNSITKNYFQDVVGIAQFSIAKFLYDLSEILLKKEKISSIKKALNFLNT